jgi:hypothetical protein
MSVILGQESTEQPPLPLSDETATLVPTYTPLPSETATLALDLTPLPSRTALPTPSPVSGEATLSVTVELTDFVELTAESTSQAELTAVVEATAETVKISIPSATPTSSSTPYILVGQARYQNRPQQDGIELRVYNAEGLLLGQTLNDAQGQFRVSLYSSPPLRVVARAPLHLSQSVILSAITAPPVFIILPGGDLDGDSCVGPTDLAQLTAHYGSDASSSDVDGDGLVEAGDLAILSSNFGLGDLCAPTTSPIVETTPTAESTAVETAPAAESTVEAHTSP